MKYIYNINLEVTVKKFSKIIFAIFLELVFDLEKIGHGQQFSNSSKAFIRCNYGANLAILHQIFVHLLC